MSQEKLREEFEAALMSEWRWPRSALLRRNQPGHPKDGEYRSDEVEAAWWGWKRSRSEVVVKLPNPNDTIEESSMYKQWLEAIEAAGLKVAP